MKLVYESINLRSKTLDRIAQANVIIAEYEERGFKLTVRQIYYQFVARGLIENKIKSYNNIAVMLNRGRMAGLIDWEMIEDRTRTTHQNGHWETPADIVQSAAYSYGIDSRADQEYYIEVWIEKDALRGIIDPICKELDVLHLACKGYYSLSSMWRGAQRIRSKTGRLKESNQKGVILHFGDHDPSGIDMTRDIQDRCRTFGADVEVKRIALTMKQIKKFKPPKNPVKLTDSRSGPYVQQYGESSWELDALSPEVIVELIESEVGKLTDETKRRKRIKLQEKNRGFLQDLAEELS